MCSLSAHNNGTYQLKKGITAGFMAHTAMKVLLEFEDISLYLQYNARNEFFSNTQFKPSVECKDSNCMKLQESKKNVESWLEKRKKVIEGRRQKVIEERKANDIPDDNEWDIELIDEDEGLAGGESIKKEEVDQADIGDLMAKFQAM